MPKILAAELPLLESKFIPHAAHPCPFRSALSLSALLPIHQLPLSLAARPTLDAPASSSERASRPPLADRASGRRSLPPSPPPRAQPGRASSSSSSSSSSGAGSVPQREGTDGGRGGAGAGEVPQPNGARRQRGASVEPSRGGWVDADGEPAAEGPGHRFRPGFLNSCRLAKTDPAAVTQLMSSCRLVPASEYMMMLPELLFFFLLRFD